MSSDSDEHLVRYLLGDLPHAEAERLDERSITDDAFALRLRVLENDLVDKYARGEPFDVSLERFDRMYRLSPHLREKLQFAEALHALTAKSEPGRVTRRIASAPGQFAWWSLAAAAVLLMAVSGYLVVRDLRLRDDLAQLEARRASVERQNEQLQQQLGQERPSTTAQPSPVTATFLLRPPRRGLGNDTTTVSVRQGTEQVTLRLEVESDNYAAFHVALRDLATRRIVWRSPDLRPEANTSDRVVTFTVPVSLLLTQRYSVELSGVSRSGSSELIGHYPIRVVLE